MSGEARCAREGCSARLYGRDGYCSISCEDLHRTEQERDEARAEVERLTVICEEAGMQVGLLEREVERLRRGIEAYRTAHGCDDKEGWTPQKGRALMDGERITEEEMNALRDVLAEASPTPWQADFGGCHFSTMAGGYNDVGECIEASDGRAIVAVMNAVPRLLAEVKHLRDGIEAYREVIALYRDTPRTGQTGCTCSVCDWEREDKKRKESSNER